MEFNLWAIITATIAQFIVGALWYMAIFGNVWGQIHGFDQLSKEKQKEMASKMGPFYGLQILMTIFTTITLSWFFYYIPDMSMYTTAFMAWFGLMLPVQVSAVVFGGTEPRWIVKKTVIMVLGSLVSIMVASFVLGLFA